MRNYFYEKQEGYVLVTVLIMFAIFSILGLSLMSYTIGSQSFSAANTDFIETKTEAEMTAQEAEAYIQKGVDSINANLAGGTLNFQDVISRVAGVMNDTRSKLDEKGELKAKIIKDGTNGVFLQRVDIEVDVQGSNKKFVRTLTVSTIADVFQYSAVTPGKLELNGPSYLKGDVQVGGNLYVDDHGYFTSSYNRHWVPSAYPGIEGDLRVENNYFHKTQDRSLKRFNPVPNSLEQYFSISPRIIDQSVKIEEIDVRRIINEKRNHPLRNGGRLPQVNEDHTIQSTVTYNGGLSVSSAYQRCNFFFYCVRASDLSINSGGRLHLKGDLHVSRDLYLKGDLKVDGSIYIERNATLSGKLELSEGSFIFIEGNANIENLKMVQGAMYINESLDINGDIDTNSAIYTRSGGRIEGIENDSGTLIVLSEGPLTIANNNLYINPGDEQLKTINAFFYTNSDLDMYGVGSNLVIKGGIYGKNITLNAVKGKTKDRGVGSHTHFYNGDLWFERGQQSLPMTQSRFKIDYEEKLISNPPDGIPTVEKITLKEIDSHFYEQ